MAGIHRHRAFFIMARSLFVFEDSREVERCYLHADARVFALPMERGKSLNALGDGLTAPEALDLLLERVELALDEGAHGANEKRLLVGLGKVHVALLGPRRAAQPAGSNQNSSIG